MANARTAISIPDWLLRDMDEIASEEKISRSAAFCRAAAALVTARRNQRVLDQLDVVYADAPTDEERQSQEQNKQYAAGKVIDEW